MPLKWTGVEAFHLTRADLIYQPAFDKGSRDRQWPRKWPMTIFFFCASPSLKNGLSSFLPNMLLALLLADDSSSFWGMWFGTANGVCITHWMWRLFEPSPWFHGFRVVRFRPTPPILWGWHPPEAPRAAPYLTSSGYCPRWPLTTPFMCHRG